MFKLWISAGAALLFFWLISSKTFTKWIFILWRTLPRDLRALRGFTKVNLTLQKWEKLNETVHTLFSKWVQNNPNKIAFELDDQKWSYKTLDEFSNKVANYFSKSLVKGDTVALIMENRPEYIGFWLGLAKIGAVTALINTNLANDPLIHSIEVSKAKQVIYSSQYAKAVDSVKAKLKDLTFLLYADSSTFESNIQSEESCLNKKSKSLNPDPKTRDKLMYIYTSGTTGLPKAALITNSRFLFMVTGMHFMTEIEDSDSIYDPLPLYHSAGGIVGVGQALVFGNKVALRGKFSASNFWADCKRYNCTVAQYIGETCRYILAAHKPNEPVDHPVRKMYGNGLRPQIWKQFQETFKVKQIYEFYGSTEGNSNLINIDNKVGAVGFVPPYAKMVYPVVLLKVDEGTGQPIRNSSGFCVACKPGEPGIFFGKINPKRSVNAFSGYADKAATESKMVRDVFTKGDLYFNSGDLLVQDEYGYYYFKDRTGDTFRWKGENVATAEIEAAISGAIDLKDSIVYGVEIPGTEGRAGMAAIFDPDDSLDKAKLYLGLKNNLPAYAIPLFIRVLRTVPLTGTFKLKKKDLQDEGFDLDRIKDHVYFLDSKQQKYVILNRELFESLKNGIIKV